MRVRIEPEWKSMLGFRNYNYERFSRERLDEFVDARFSGPEAGEQAADFTAESLDGETVRLSDYQGDKNVLLVFGSATCPMTAATIGEINALYDEFRDEVEFLFVYVREAHPGERIPAHGSMEEKIAAARLLREAEDLEMPVLVDDLRGSIHRHYSGLPNSAFLIDRSGHVAFRSMWANPEALAAAIDELLEVEEDRRTDHAVVRGGEDLSMPLTYAMLRSHRALQRGGRQAIYDFHAAVGRGPRAAKPESQPLLKNPGRILSIAALTTAVLAGGIYAGFELRRRRLGLRRNPYRAYEKEKVRDTETGEDYGAVGI
jgi:alkyl hydroperoxide reductase subunit AhpC